LLKHRKKKPATSEIPSRAMQQNVVKLNNPFRA